MRQRLGLVGPVSTDRAGVPATFVELHVDLAPELLASAAAAVAAL